MHRGSWLAGLSKLADQEYTTCTRIALLLSRILAARVAMQVLSRVSEGNLTSTDHGAEEDREDEEKDELLSLCSCLDGVVGQLHTQVETLKSYQTQPQEPAGTTWTVQSKIVDMYDICAYVQVHKASLLLTQEDTLLQRSTKLRCQILLATCKFLPRNCCTDPATHQDTDSTACVPCCKS